MKFAFDALRLVAKPETVRETLLATTRLAGEASELLPTASTAIGRFAGLRPAIGIAEKLPTLELGTSKISGAFPQTTTFAKYAAEHPLPTLKLDAPGSDKMRAILAEAAPSFDLVGKMERGTRGAWLVNSPDKNPLILKVVSQEDVTKQFQLVKEAARQVDSFSVRAPRIERVGYSAQHGTWYLQEVVPGFNAAAPTTRLIAQMIKFNERQIGTALKGQKNWSDDVMGSLYKDSRGWQERIANSGDEGKALVQEVRSLTEKNRYLRLPAGDTVHGDYQHYNALVSGGRKERLTAVVDWDHAGRGDRGIDLSRLLYDGYVAQAELGFKANPQTLKMLGQHIESISGRAAYENYMNYWVLQVSDFGVKMGPDKAKMFMGVGRRILDDLKPQQSLLSRLSA